MTLLPKASSGGARKISPMRVPPDVRATAGSVIPSAEVPVQRTVEVVDTFMLGAVAGHAAAGKQLKADTAAIEADAKDAAG